ncbi:YkvA family protein [Thalassotalea aquiviva]|uniref:YkvA family protein n=1 Tax=Thalassotalea aquiviva TaxID=3242415 RepID=UPI00352A2218
MAIEVTFELSDEDLDHFRKVMHQAQQSAKHLDPDVILTNAKELITNVNENIPVFVKNRIAKLSTLIEMIEDNEWQIPEEEGKNVISALAYFSEPEDLVPDHIPALGFLDDAIMIELVASELENEIDAFTEFCEYRHRERHRQDVDEITKEDWLDAKRRELHSRMKNRRTKRRRRSLFV